MIKRYYHPASWFKVKIVWSVTSWKNTWMVLIKPYKTVEQKSMVFKNSRLVDRKSLLLLS